MNQAPWTDIGHLQNEVREIKNTLHNKANSHEIHSINSRLDSVERSCRELSATFNEILSRLQKHEEDKMNPHP